MKQNTNEDFQYNSCTSRGICSINPRISALQAILILYLKIFAKYLIKTNVNNEIEELILNTIIISINNTDLSDKKFITIIEKLKNNLSIIIENYYHSYKDQNYEIDKEKTDKLFKKTSDISDSIKYGEYILNENIKQIPNEIKDLYNIMLIILKNISINALDLSTYDRPNKKAIKIILEILNTINIEKYSVEELKTKINKIAQFDCKLMKEIRCAQEKAYGIQQETEVSFSTQPNKAILVVGYNIKELENILENVKNENIDVYTHDDMILAHTFPKFRKYAHLKGHFGKGLENCLIDFANFPGPIILTRNSLHNIENFYRGRLFTTDYSISPKGVIKIDSSNFEEVITSAKKAKGFKTGKICNSIIIGFNYDEITELIDEKIKSCKYKQIFIIGPDENIEEQKYYFENLIKLAPKDILIITFSFKYEQENVVNINTCYDSISWTKILNFVLNYKLSLTIFIPKCYQTTFSQIIYYSKFKNTEFYLGKCAPILLNPSLIKTFVEIFSIKKITNFKNDLKKIIKDKT